MSSMMNRLLILFWNYCIFYRAPLISFFSGANVTILNNKLIVGIYVYNFCMAAPRVIFKPLWVGFPHRRLLIEGEDKICSFSFKIICVSGLRSAEKG